MSKREFAMLVAEITRVWGRKYLFSELSHWKELSVDTWCSCNVEEKLPALLENRLPRQAQEILVANLRFNSLYDLQTKCISLQRFLYLLSEVIVVQQN